MGGFDIKAYVDAHEKPSFDIAAYVAQGNHGADEADIAGPAQAAVEHFGNAATMGYLPQLQAVAGKLMPNPNSDVDAQLAAKGFKIQQPSESYVDARDANIKRMKQQSVDHPYASAAGTIGGIIGGGALASAALPAGAAAATLGGKVIQGAKAGAVYGALANPGDTEGEIDPIQAGSRAKGAAVGAIIGGAIPVAVDGVKRGAGWIGEYLGDKAALKASRALGRPTPTMAAKMAESGQDKELGRDLLDSGAIPILSTPNRITARVDALKDKVGKTIGDLIGSAGDSKMIDGEALGVKILDSPELSAMRKTPGMESTVTAIEKQVETLAKNGQMTVKEAQALRQGIDKSINFNKAAPDMRGAQEGLYMQRTALRNGMNDALNSLPTAPVKDALIKANRQYGNLSTASDILDREIARNQTNRAVSLTDTIAGAAGLATGAGPVGAAVLGGLNKAGRTFGNSIQARGYDAVSKGMPAVAKAAGVVGANPMIAQVAAQSAVNPSEDKSAPQAFDEDTLGVFRSNPGLIDSIANPQIRRALQKSLGRDPAQGPGVDRKPSGEDRWAQSGLTSLGIKDDATAQALLQSPKGKQLLIQASDLKPGSKAMQNVQSQIQQLLRGAKQ